MIQIGRVCVKIAGRDAGKKCVVIDILDDRFALIDGETRRRKCNVMHLEPVNQVMDIKKNASHDEVSKAFEQIGLKVRETKPKGKKEKPKQKRKTPEQLKARKEEKKKLRDLFRTKKEEKESKAESGLEEKAGIKGK
ncbi:50S ribosomal protein L14e, partial [Candidatus Woesearchaeota archaeon]|nr:50S ribosomal protein L14e [Candidatus Woesearchaeota archaeon]